MFDKLGELEQRFRELADVLDDPEVATDPPRYQKHARAYAELQDFYRRGLDQLGTLAQERFGSNFVALEGAQQDEIIAALEDGNAQGFEWPSAQAFFNTLRTHTMEGMFADPVYGGNKDFAGWRLVGFPGAHACRFGKQ